MEHLICNVPENKELISNAYTTNGIISFIPNDSKYVLMIFKNIINFNFLKISDKLIE